MTQPPDSPDPGGTGEQPEQPPGARPSWAPPSWQQPSPTSAPPQGPASGEAASGSEVPPGPPAPASDAAPAPGPFGLPQTPSTPWSPSGSSGPSGSPASWGSSGSSGPSGPSGEVRAASTEPPSYVPTASGSASGTPGSPGAGAPPGSPPRWKAGVLAAAVAAAGLIGGVVGHELDRGSGPASTLAPVPAAGGNYVHWVQTGNLLYLAGKGPLAPEGKPRPTGKVGTEVTIEQAYQHARSVGLVLIAVLEEALGDLDRVSRVVKVLGMVNAAPDFGDQPKVINGYSDLMKDVFGEAGIGTRSAVGMGALPGGIAVEIEAIFQVKD